MRDGSIIRLVGQGAAGANGAPPGDLYLHIGLEPVEWAGPTLFFDAAAVPRLQMILRLRRDTGVNLAGIGMILDLLDRLRALDRENQWLRAQQ